jgi:hypothetical protein
MRAAVQAMLAGMPDPADLHVERAGPRCLVMVGAVALADYDAADTVMRNFAVITARRSGFGGKRVAEAFGLSAAYVSTLNAAARREGSAALVKHAGPGRPRTLAGDSLGEARRLRESGASDREIGRRLGVAGTTAGRRLGPGGSEPAAETRPAPEPGVLFSEEEARAAAGVPEPAPAPAPAPGAGAGPVAGHEASPSPSAVPVPVPPVPVPPAPAAGAGLVRGPGGIIAEGRVRSRYAGAMLLHAFASRASAAGVLGLASGGDRAGTGVLAAVSACFGLGAATAEQFKHLERPEAGLLGGLAVLPELRTLRPALAVMADRADPLRLQEMLAAAMLAADPVLSGVYYVDDHFVPYTGAKPVAKGWNNKRGRAERGRADTHVTAYDGRAVCFVTGEPSGLATTLPRALAELKKVIPPGSPVMLGFDRGGAYPQVFRHCRHNGVHWVTWRRAPLAVPSRLPILARVTFGGRERVLAWAEETVEIKDYGQARQITLFEHGAVAMQILTSDSDACPAAILSWLKSRWREENFLKYASENYGIDKICDYAAVVSENTKQVPNPARTAANAAVRDAEKALAAAERALAVLLGDPALTPAAKNAAIPAATRRINAARRQLQSAEDARRPVPAKLPANEVDPDARTALLRAGRRTLQMVLRLLAHNAEHYVATRLNAYLRDDDEYRATARETIIRGLAGTVGFTAAVTVTLDPPGQPRVARALGFLLDEINAAPPSIPGDPRPVAYRLAGTPA